MSSTNSKSMSRYWVRRLAAVFLVAATLLAGGLQAAQLNTASWLQYEGTMGGSMNSSAHSVAQQFALVNGAWASDYQIYGFDRGDGTIDDGGEWDHQQAHFGSTRLLGDGALHFGGAFTENERRFDLGVSFGKLTLSVISGEGEDYQRLKNGWQNFDPWFVHGGRSGEFTFQGGSVGLDMGTSSAFMGAYQLKAAAASDRTTFTLGLAGNHWRGAVYLLEQAGAEAANAVDLGLLGGAFSIDYQQLSAENGARMRRIDLAWLNQQARTLSFSLESLSHPLYPDGEDTRLMISMGGSWGHQNNHVLRAADAPQTSEEQEAQKRRRTARGFAIAGGVAVGVAIAGSSGGSDDDFRSNAQHAAAERALNTYNPRSVRENREYGGWIVRNADGSYKATTPNRGNIDSVNPGPRPGRATASYHTHAAFDPRYDNENFSSADIQFNIFSRVDGYLGTPAGAFKYFQLSNFEISTLGTVKNR